MALNYEIDAERKNIRVTAPSDGFTMDGVRTLAALPTILNPASRRAVVVRSHGGP